jgi:hypothetical protein
VRFLSEHLPACTCPDPVRRFRHELQAALGHLLADVPPVACRAEG